jgi:hypothetical protein
MLVRNVLQAGLFSSKHLLGGHLTVPLAKTFYPFSFIQLAIASLPERILPEMMSKIVTKIA